MPSIVSIPPAYAEENASLKREKVRPTWFKKKGDLKGRHEFHHAFTVNMWFFFCFLFFF